MVVVSALSCNYNMQHPSLNSQPTRCVFVKKAKRRQRWRMKATTTKNPQKPGYFVVSQLPWSPRDSIKLISKTVAAAVTPVTQKQVFFLLDDRVGRTLTNCRWDGNRRISRQFACAKIICLVKIQIHKRFKITLFIRTKRNMRTGHSWIKIK